MEEVKLKRFYRTSIPSKLTFDVDGCVYYDINDPSEKSLTNARLQCCHCSWSNIQQPSFQPYLYSWSRHSTIMDCLAQDLAI